MGQAAHVVKIQCVGLISWPGDIGMRPIRRSFQIEMRIGVRQIWGQISVPQCEIEFSRSKLEIVSPFALRIEIEGRYCQKVSFRRSIGKIEDVFRIDQAFISERRVYRLKYLKTP